jgi:hypothetical protein
LKKRLQKGRIYLSSRLDSEKIVHAQFVAKIVQVAIAQAAVMIVQVAVRIAIAKARVAKIAINGKTLDPLPMWL